MSTPAQAQGPDLGRGVQASAIVDALRAEGAVFAYVHGSRAHGTHDERSDIDVAAWFGTRRASWEVPLPAGVDLLVLDTAPDELAGRVAQHGVVLFEDDPAARVRWQARTSKQYLHDAYRRAQIRRDVQDAASRG